MACPATASITVLVAMGGQFSRFFGISFLLPVVLPTFGPVLGIFFLPLLRALKCRGGPYEAWYGDSSQESEQGANQHGGWCVHVERSAARAVKFSAAKQKVI
jgi:hypothetical protein